MTITKDDRYHLHQQLEGALDERGATTMMELLPPVGWADVATKRDLDQLEERTELRFDKVDMRLQGVDQRFDQLDQRFDQLDQRLSRTDRHIDDATDKMASKLRAEFADAGRKTQGVLLTAIIAGTGFLAALSVFGPT